MTVRVSLPLWEEGPPFMAEYGPRGAPVHTVEVSHLTMRELMALGRRCGVGADFDEPMWIEGVRRLLRDRFPLDWRHGEGIRVLLERHTRSERETGDDLAFMAGQVVRYGVNQDRLDELLRRVDAWWRVTGR